MLAFTGRNRCRCAAVAGLGGVLVLGTAAIAGAPSIEVVVDEGTFDPVSGGTVSSLDAPFTAGGGEVGFVGSLDLGLTSVTFVWFDDGIVFRDTDALPTVLSGGGGTMGVGDGGRFIYVPIIDGKKGTWTDTGQLARVGDPAPGFPGRFLTLTLQPRMLPDGTAYFVGGFDDGSSGAANRALYRASPTGEMTPVVAGGDPVDGSVIRPGAGPDAGIQSVYEPSDNDAHLIQRVKLDAERETMDTAVVVDRAIVAREGDPVDGSESWGTFDIVSVNDGGEFIFAGETTGVGGGTFVTHGTCIRVRDGDVVDGVDLSGHAPMAASINNKGQVAHLWRNLAATLFAGNAVDLRDSSIRLLGTDDPIDTDGNGDDDATIVQFRANPDLGPGLDLAEDGFVHVHVDVRDTTSQEVRQAILRVELPPLPCPEDIDGGGGIGFNDLTLLLGSWGPCDCCRADLNASGAVGFEDLTRLLGNWGPCP